MRLLVAETSQNFWMLSVSFNSTQQLDSFRRMLALRAIQRKVEGRLGTPTPAQPSTPRTTAQRPTGHAKPHRQAAAAAAAYLHYE